MKIIVNKCYGGFGVTKEVLEEMGFKKDTYLDNEAFGITSDNMYAYRADKRLIEAIEKIGEEEASDGLAKLKIVEIPNDVEWEIDEYDGIEKVHEVHRSW